MSTPRDVAQWMLEEYNKSSKYLPQKWIVHEIQERFGEEFVYQNSNGNLAIRKDVLAEFRNLTPDAVWVSGKQLWRERDKWEDKKSRAAR